VRATRVAAALIVAGVLLVASPASASQPVTCAGEVLAFQTRHRPIWVGAGSPGFICVFENTPGLSGTWDGRSVTIYPNHHPAIAPDAYYREIIAHETGHAWASAHHVDMIRYASIRQLPPGTVPRWVNEDYAETFAYALGYWTGFDGPPYAFRAGAGRPTPRQIGALRSAHLLPG
jgi:hypothetical protein